LNKWKNTDRYDDVLEQYKKLHSYWENAIQDNSINQQEINGLYNELIDVRE
jgi:hypothetical protein